MIWFYFIILLLCPKTTILVNSSSIANQLVAVAEPEPARGGGVVNKCFHKEIHVLLHFKASLKDPLGLLSTWRPQDDDCCKWRGVTCNNQTFHVTELHLSGNYVQGEISPSLVNLSYLNHLDLSQKKIEGEITPSLVNLSYLNHLDLSYNEFNGTLPKSVGSLTQLRYLDLSHNLFHGTIPSEFGNLTKLQNLSLGDSGPSRVENLDWLFSLSHLQSLEMNMVSLAKANHWVDVILSLQKLSSLSLRACDLSEVKHPYSSFVNSSLSSITFLSLEHNNLNSSMYRWLFPLTSNRLVVLVLSYNMLDGIPKYLKNLSSLESFSLFNNSAVVHFPDFLNNLCGLRLRQLVASNGRFTGSVPDEIQKFSSL